MNSDTNTSRRGDISLLRRILVVLAVIVLYRIGCSLPAPGVGSDLDALDPSLGGGVNLFNLFAGGPLTQTSIFALGVTPFITAAIAMQLLESVVPAIKEAKRSGRAGVERVNRITRLIAVVLAVVQSVAAAFSLNAQSGPNGSLGLFPELGVLEVALFSLSATVGFLALLWLAELITRHGIGNGVTVLLLVSILSSAWAASAAFIAERGVPAVLVFTLVLLALAALVVVGVRAERRIPVVQATRFDLDTSHLSYLPFRLLHAGVAPVIFATSVVGVVAFGLGLVLPAEQAATLTRPDSLVHMAVVAVLVVLFARLYERTSADPVEIANDLVRDSRFIPGVRPGWPTANLVENSSLRLAMVACVLLVPLALMQSIALRGFDLAFLPLAGTSLLIVVSAVLDVTRQATSVRSLYAYDEVTR